MPGMLSPEQMAQFEQALAQGGAPEDGNMPPEPEAPPTDGAPMAPPGADAPPEAPPAAPAQPNQPPADPYADLLASVGVGSVEELVQGFSELSASLAQTQEALDQMLAMQEAMGNEDELDPTDPEYSMKKYVREFLAPVAEKFKAQELGNRVRDAWNESAKGMPDLADHMEEITQYMMENGVLSTTADGLQRAYDHVRGSKYRNPDALLADPEFLKKAASNDGLKNMVIEAYLANIAKNGELPTSIGDGGSPFMTGKKGEVQNMADAKAATLALLQANK